MPLIETPQKTVYFAHIPKTAGSTVYKAFEHYLKARVTFPKLKISADQKHCLPSHIDAEFDVSLTIIRNPLEWHESWWRYLHTPSVLSRGIFRDGKPEFDLWIGEGIWHPLRAITHCYSESFEQYIENIIAYNPAFVSDMYKNYIGEFSSPDIDCIIKCEELAEGLSKFFQTEFGDDQELHLRTHNPSFKKDLVWRYEHIEKLLNSEYAMPAFGYEVPQNLQIARRHHQIKGNGMEDKSFHNPPSSAAKDDRLREFSHNGFAVFRDVFSKPDIEVIRSRIEENTKIAPGDTIIDVANVDPTSESLVFSEPLLSCVRACIGDDIAFLKWSTYQIDHTSHPWHRDGAFRDYGVGMDWREPSSYSVAKAILYLRCDQFALAVMPNSHRLDIDRTKIPSGRDEFFEVGELDEIDESIFDDGDEKPTLVRVNPGDIVVFDQRILHCGRNLDDTEHGFLKDVVGPKHFYSVLYGAKNAHSERFYSFFEFERGFGQDRYNPEFRDRLEKSHMLFPLVEENYFERHPEEREGIFTLPSAPPEASKASDDKPEDGNDKPEGGAGAGLFSWLAGLTGRRRARD